MANTIPTFTAWQSVKVTREDSEHAGRAGVYLRDEGGGLVVKLDADATRPESIVNFAAGEVQAL